MKEADSEQPLFVKTFDFLVWLTAATNHFPRLHRHTVTRRLLEAALSFQETILTANNLRGRARLDTLERADAELDKVRVYLRLAHRVQWLNLGQYEHAGRSVAEIGRLLGGWQKLTRQSLKTGNEPPASSTRSAAVAGAN